ncbi:choice-of-anchor Q domain-containing protein [Fuerstiella marisgermanici]|uniref:choice-of-anchor Q domain-containing protein n=1 Tax=Fuerstiella marisgermanici TaxID=1891926 RepID=UPI0013147293|nr:choice-of-anchor Q domain-containing protein [Fuerstiella marisgermanici]
MLEQRSLLTTFNPTTPSELIANINTANTNGEDDTIDLGGQTFTFDQTNFFQGAEADGRNAVPSILSDGGNVVTIINGHLQRDAASTANFRLLHVSGNAELNLEGVTISGGDSRSTDAFQATGNRGGGIFVSRNATLNVTSSVIRDNTTTNSGGGISNRGYLTIEDSLISGNTAVSRFYTNGGGLVNAQGTVIVRSSTFTENAADSGGAILTSGSGSSLDIDDSLLSGNEALTGSGGAIRNSSATTVTNSTISDNRAGTLGGGVYNLNGGLTATNTTITGNRAGTGGGGIQSYAVTAVTLNNTIVAGNSLNSGASNDIEATTPATGFNNLIGDAATSGGFMDGVNGNIVGNGGTGTIDITTVLDSNLAANGGPTLTHALIDGSPAIDGGDNTLAAGLDFDQRGAGFNRIIEGTVDIGAFEAEEAASLVVTTDQDVVNANDGLTSLREAIAFANSDPDFSEITFGDGSSLAGGTSFIDATPDTITLGGTQLVISSDVTLSGPGADLLTIDAAGASRVLRIAPGNFDVTLDSLSLINGDSIDDGGGILNSSHGVFTLSNSVLASNTSARTGGGLSSFENGTVRILDSTVTGNHADSGGGITSLGNVPLIIDGSAITANTATVVGGGVYVGGQLRITNSTIADNVSALGGGILQSAWTAEIVNSTIAGNRATDPVVGGGGIFNVNDLDLTISNSLIAGNVAPTGSDFSNTYTTGSTTINNSIVGDASDIGTTSGSNNQFDIDWKTVLENDGLVPILADNGGPTQTIALLPGSPAINAGDDAAASGLSTDQRGETRFVSTVDIGAFEAQEAASLVVTTDQDVVNANDGLTSLREALAFANSDPDFSEITFGDGSSLPGGTSFIDATPDTITLGGTQLEISSDVTITAPGADLLTVSGDDQSRVFDVLSGDVTFDSLKISDGTAQAAVDDRDNGAGVRVSNTAEVAIYDSVISDNLQRYGNGAGIHNEGVLTILRSAIVHNLSAKGNGGGGISNDGGTLTISDSSVSQNDTTDVGGGIWNIAGTLIITNSTIANNIGGGVHVSAGTVSVVNSTVAGNRLELPNQGGFTNVNGTVSLQNSIVAANDRYIPGSGPIDVMGTVTGNNNVISELSSSGGLQNGLNGNIVGGDWTTVLANDGSDPILADNGGPTETIALLPGSPAINAGDNAAASGLTTDQRGESRFVGTVDIGALEAPAVTLAQAISDATVLEDASDEVIELSQTFADSSAVMLSVFSDNTSLVNATLSGTELTLNFGTDQNGTAEITVIATDGPLQTTETFTVTVSAVNDAPTVLTPVADVTVDEDSADEVIDLSNVFADIDSSSLTLTAASSDGTVVGTSVSGTDLTLSFPADANGSATVTVTADDGALTVSDTFSVTVSAVNDAPTVVTPIADVTVDEDAADEVIDLAGVFDDIDGDTLTLTAVSSDGTVVGTSVSGTNLTLSFPADANGSATVTVTADDGALTVSDTFSVTVSAVNDAPTVVTPIADVTVDEDAADEVIDLAGVFDDIDGDTLTLTAVSSDGTVVGTSVSGTNLTLSFPADANGSATVTVTADDGALTVSDTFSVTVNAVNDAPTVDSTLLPDFAVDEGSSDVTIDLSTVFADVDDATLVYSAQSSDGTIVATNLSADLLTLSFPADGAATITVTATDAAGASVSDDFIVTVNDVVTEPDPGVTVVDGKLIITGTDGNDSILVKKFFGKYYVYTNIPGFTFTKINASQVDEICVDGGAGNDTIVMGWFVYAPTTLNGGAGNDYIVGGFGNDLIDGGEGDDCLHGDTGDDTIFGGDGDDWIDGGWGDDIVYAGAGDDYVWGGFGDDILLGQAGNDRMYGGSGRDIIIAGEGADRLYGQGQDDILITGDTNWDDDEDALKAMRDVWTGRGSARNRAQAVHDSGLEVFHDDDVDKVWGGWGLDWMLFDRNLDRAYC